MTLAPILHPELCRLPPEQRRAVLREARRTPLDILELVGMAAALIAAIVFVRGGPESLGEPTTALEGNTPESIVAGIAVGGILAILFLVRRTRRGLRRVLAQR
jgi:hypothetical protein